MASFDQHNRESQQKPGIIQKILNLLSITMPKPKSRSHKRSQSKSHSAKAKTSSHSQAQAKHVQSQPVHHKKSAHTSEHKAEHRAEHKETSKANHKEAHKAKSASRRRRPKHHAATKQVTHATAKTDHALQNPKDVIPHESHQSPDPAHSPGHRKVHIEKDLH